MMHSKHDRGLIAQAAEWRLIGLLLEGPRGNWHTEVAQLAREVRKPDLRAAVATSHDATEGDYLRLLGPGGLVSPREVAYQSFADPGQLLAELTAWYEAFAFRSHVDEPGDHIAVEVAFVGYLLLKEAFASARADADAAKTAAHARRAFIDAHLAAFAVRFAERLAATGASYLVAPAQLLARRMPRHHTPPHAEAARGVCGECGFDDSW
jgi:TorA maturation chaperone TorD